jgi:hypothetical protein
MIRSDNKKPLKGLASTQRQATRLENGTNPSKGSCLVDYVCTECRQQVDYNTHYSPLQLKK